MKTYVWTVAAMAKLTMLVVVSGCVDGGGPPGESGSLSMQAVWQQPSEGRRLSARAHTPGFTSELPDSVERVRVTFKSSTPVEEGGLHCCVKVDPERVVDGTSHLLVLDDLPPGAATVTMAGFTGTQVSNAGLPDVCVTQPADVGEPCDAESPRPRFASDLRSVDIRPAVENDGGILELREVASTVRGTVVNCLDASPIAGASVTLLMSGGTTAISGDDGSFRIDQAPADFELSTMARGFITTTLSGTIDPLVHEAVVRVAICPVSLSLRVVLTWGNSAPAPADLDAHLRGPAPRVAVAGQPVEFHVDFGAPRAGSFAALDIDDTMHAGPETVTVSEVVPGIYRYCVHNFTDRDNSGSKGFDVSQAVVRVFSGNQQLGEPLRAPAGIGDVWNVFSIDTSGGSAALTPINTITQESSPQKVCRRMDDTDGDGLTDAQEQDPMVRTDPQKFDTDGNQRSDGDDVIAAQLAQVSTRTSTPATAPSATPRPILTSTPLANRSATPTIAVTAGSAPSVTPSATATPTVAVPPTPTPRI